MTLTSAQLLQIMPYARTRVDAFVDPLNACADEFQINTPKRLAMFLAQIAHESGELRYVKELASGELYEGRKNLGNIQPGDGVKFKGRGLIQVTGRTNYTACSLDLFKDANVLLEHPEKLEEPLQATRSAAWFWKGHRLNEIADTGDFLKVTKVINGGTNGLLQRQAYWMKAKMVLGAM